MRKIYLMAIVILFASTLSGQINKTNILKITDFKESGFLGNKQQKNKSKPVHSKRNIILSNQSSVTKQRLDSAVAQTFDSIANKMSFSNKISNTYNNAGNLVLSNNYYWDDLTLGWVTDKTEYTYDNSGNMTMAASYLWNAALNKWQQDLKDDYTYNSDNLMTSDIISNGVLDQWVYTSKEVYAYDQKGNLTTDQFYSYLSGSFSPSHKSEYTYTEFDKISKNIYYDSDGAGGWSPVYKLDYFYDSNRNDTTELTSTWNIDILNWDNSSVKNSTNYTYTQNGIVTGKVSTYYFFDTSINLWTILNKTEYVYDNNGNETAESSYHWDYLTNSLVGDTKFEFQYDYNYSLNDVLYSDFFKLLDIQYGNKLGSYKIYTSSGSDWIENGNVNLYYSAVEIRTATKNVLSEKINIYPNPFISTFQLKGIEGSYTLSLMNVSGKVMLTKQATGNENISVSALPKGLYIFKVISNDRTFTGKIAKE